jgi:glycosyltransferase involved in cell wall biosynthesis
MNPLISIVTVSLNAATTIEDTIASVAMQSIGFEIEHICVDGGSTDGSREIIDRWAARSSHIRKIYESDRGISDAMNKGLQAARGEYVLFLNADDFLVAHSTLAKAMHGLSLGSAENPDLISGGASMGRLERRGIWRHRHVPKLLGKVKGFGLFPVHQGLFTKRHLLVECGGFNTQLLTASDVILYYDLEAEFPLSMRLLRSDVAFMRAGGSANVSMKIRYQGTVDMYRHLVLKHGVARAAAMVIVKTMQSFFELRYGSCPHKRWFVQRINHD